MKQAKILPPAARTAPPARSEGSEGIKSSIGPSGLPYVDPEDMPDLYAIKGVGTCMEPLFADRSLLVGDKRETPRPGDTVILHFTREAAARYGIPGWVKRLVLGIPPEGFDGLLIVEQLNPLRQFFIRKRDVAAVHKIVGTATSEGNGIAAFRPAKMEG